jgi:hypothetical protein
VRWYREVCGAVDLEPATEIDCADEQLIQPDGSDVEHRPYQEKVDVLYNLEDQSAWIVRNVSFGQPEVGEPDLEGELNQADAADDEDGMRTHLFR